MTQWHPGDELPPPTPAATPKEALTAAMHALRSYQYGNASPELAESVADVCQAALQAPAVLTVDEGLLTAEQKNALRMGSSGPLTIVRTTADSFETFQSGVDAWMLACFGAAIAADITERNHRFLEEALELVQSTGCTASEAHQLVDYVFGRPVGEPHQEAGGVMVTFAALCSAIRLRSGEAAATELARVWTKVEQIRAKQAAKPKHSPLPEAFDRERFLQDDSGLVSSAPGGKLRDADLVAVDEGAPLGLAES